MKVEGPISFSGLATSNDFTIYNLPAGDYAVTLEQEGCTQTVNASVGIGEGQPSLSLSTTEDECGISDGVVVAYIEGTSDTYELFWNGPTSGSQTVTGSAAIGGLITGNYEVGFEDENGCMAFAYIDLNATSLSLAVETAKAIDGNNGFIRLDVQGGVPGYVVAWEGPESGSRALTEPDESISLPDGIYEVTVTDAMECTATATAIIDAVINIFADGRNSGNPFNSSILENEVTIVLHQNFPNPFNGSTTIRFELAAADNVQLVIHDQFGRTILANRENYAKGWNEYNFNGSHLAAGHYFYSLITKEQTVTKRMILN